MKVNALVITCAAFFVMSSAAVPAGAATYPNPIHRMVEGLIGFSGGTVIDRSQLTRGEGYRYSIGFVRLLQNRCSFSAQAQIINPTPKADVDCAWTIWLELLVWSKWRA
jgi:hypothetical protein